jgi:hypothetical protein
MEPGRLRGMLPAAPPSLGERVQDYLGGLTGDQLSAIRGIGTRLALLSESTAGPYLLPTRPAGAARELDLRAALEGGDVVLFSLNASIYGKLAAQLGALAVQDLVSATGYRLEGDRQQRPATVGIDEFSALGADNLLALLARGRESGVSVLLATQELSDLERAAPGFRDQVLGITGIKIAHRQEVPASASTISQMAGTERVWERTEPVAGLLTDPGRTRATRRQVERFIVHPNEIKTLPVGHAVMLSRLPRSEVVRALVVPPRSAATRGGRTGGGREGGAREL